MQQGFIAVIKSSNIQRIQENHDAVSCIALDNRTVDKHKLNSLDKGTKMRIFDHQFGGEAATQMPENPFHSKCPDKY